LLDLISFFDINRREEKNNIIYSFKYYKEMIDNKKYIYNINLVSLVILLTILPILTTAAPFSFHHFLQGYWNISYTKTSLETHEPIGYIEKAQWIITNANETLAGTILTGDETYAVKVVFDEDSANQSGTFYYVANDDFQKLFAFNFIPTSDESYLSTGEWTDPNFKGTYQFTIENPVSFSVVIVAEKGTSEDKSPQFITLQAHKKNR